MNYNASDVMQYNVINYNASDLIQYNVNNEL